MTQGAFVGKFQMFCWTSFMTHLTILMQRVCQLIEASKQPSIFPLLDEQCAISNSSPSEYVQKCHRLFKQHTHYVQPNTGIPAFGIQHYAGLVNYNAENFLVANSDKLTNDLKDGMKASSLAFVRELFQEQQTEKERRKRPPTTSYRFRQQVAHLINSLEKCNSHYVRQVKPIEKLYTKQQS